MKTERETQKRSELTCIKKFDPSMETVVGIINYRDTVYVATSRCVYKVVHEIVTPIELGVNETEGK